MPSNSLERETVILPNEEEMSLPALNAYVREIATTLKYVVEFLQNRSNLPIIEEWTPKLYVAGTEETGNYTSDGMYAIIPGQSDYDYLIAHGRIVMSGALANTGEIQVHNFPRTFHPSIPAHNAIAGFYQCTGNVHDPTVQVRAGQADVRFWRDFSSSGAAQVVTHTSVNSSTGIYFAVVAAVQKET